MAVEINVSKCARCSGTHSGVDFKLLSRPISFLTEDGKSHDYTHWAPCPENGEPMLLQISLTKEGGATNGSSG